MRNSLLSSIDVGSGRYGRFVKHEEQLLDSADFVEALGLDVRPDDLIES